MVRCTMNKLIILCVLSFLLRSCSSDSYEIPDLTDTKLEWTNKISDKLKVKVYVKTYGVFAANDYYYFITNDDSNLGYYVGKCDDYGRVLIQIVGEDSLWVHSYEERNQDSPTESKLFLLSKYSAVWGVDLK